MYIRIEPTVQLNLQTVELETPSELNRTNLALGSDVVVSSLTERRSRQFNFPLLHGLLNLVSNLAANGLQIIPSHPDRQKLQSLRLSSFVLHTLPVEHSVQYD